MKQSKLYNILAIIAVTAMLTSFGYLWYEYLLFTNKANATSAKTVAVAWPAIYSFTKILGIAIAASTGASLLAIIVLLLSSRNSEVQIVYVKKNEESRHGLDNANGDSEEVGQRNLYAVENILNGQSQPSKPLFEKLLTTICRELEASQAAFFVTKRYEGKRVLELYTTYAYHIAESKTFHYEFGEGLAGQVAKEGKLITIKNVPEGYITILSGLGKASPAELILAPVVYNEEVVAILEIASFKHYTRSDETFVQEVTHALSRLITTQFTEEEVIALVSPAALAMS